MAQVQRLLQATVDWKVKSEMAGIRRRVEIRKVVGERKWEQLLRASRTARVRNARAAEQRQAQRPADRPQPPAR